MTFAEFEAALFDRFVCDGPLLPFKSDRELSVGYTAASLECLCSLDPSVVCTNAANGLPNLLVARNGLSAGNHAVLTCGGVVTEPGYRQVVAVHKDRAERRFEKAGVEMVPPVAEHLEDDDDDDDVDD